MRRNELSYLANEFRIKKRHFQELPDTIVKCYSDKFVGKINPILYRITMVVRKGRENVGNLHRSVPSKKKFSVDHALITMQTHR